MQPMVLQYGYGVCFAYASKWTVISTEQRKDVSTELVIEYLLLIISIIVEYVMMFVVHVGNFGMFATPSSTV
jgi:hypothetical protein